MKKKISIKHMIGYASINFLGSGSQNIVQLYLLIFYTSLCNLSVLQAGSIFAGTRFLDAALNPIMGFITDNFGKTRLGRRFGRRRFFILLGAPLSLLVFPMMWTVGHSYAYYFGINMIWEMVFTMVIVSTIALPAEMAQTAADKTKLVAAKSYCGTIANMISSFIPAQLFVMYGENNPDAFHLTGIVYAVILALSLVVVYSLTFERAPEDIVYSNEAHGIGQVLKKLLLDISSTLKVKSFRIHTIMMLLIGIYKNLANSVFTYFVVYCLVLSKSVTGYISAFSTLISLATLTLFVALAYKFGGPKTLRVATSLVVLAALGLFGLTFLKGTSLIIPALVAVQIINTVGKGGADYIPVFQLPFMADIDEAVTGTRREGIFSGVNGAMSKIAYGVESLLLGFGLQAFGFVKGAKEQPQLAIVGVVIFATVVPTVLLITTVIVSRKLKLNKETHKILVDEVNRVKAGGSKADVTPEAREAIEELTGFAYENCFGNNNVGYHSKAANA
ncbi:MFS transporter [Clostridium cellulovorans]|uniref:Major facilitator superfamily MFS_1 n=1 Tax=Clostridium cellulovorans (strain ATCC 35296 / DSM 3052 / OCM 3 / 743B) TaxID=573061 RepID=D9SP29_CLOC7|nr:MFS transporter [Clostridium cellulovorans]ADL51994.1 major facilitator superfamily MFS_1 [Clostridium cellulovorans 743B]